MAYLCFEFEPATPAAAASLPISRETGIAFTHHEWLVIRLARKDGPASGAPESRLRRFVRTLFGLRPANGLADPRLETLRQAAARLWAGWTSLDSELIDRLRALGFSFGQLTLLSSWIVAQRN